MSARSLAYVRPAAVWREKRKDPFRESTSRASGRHAARKRHKLREMETVRPLAEEWAELERKLCRGPAWEALSDSEKEDAREYLRENFEAYKESSVEMAAACTA